MADSELGSIEAEDAEATTAAIEEEERIVSAEEIDSVVGAMLLALAEIVTVSVVEAGTVIVTAAAQLSALALLVSTVCMASTEECGTSGTVVEAKVADPLSVLTWA